MTAGVSRRDGVWAADGEDSKAGDGDGDEDEVGRGENEEEVRFIGGLIGVTAGETMVGEGMDGEDGTGNDATLDGRV